jgi:hypothetical protein
MSSVGYVTSRSGDIELGSGDTLAASSFLFGEDSRLRLLVQDFHDTTLSPSTCLLFAPTKLTAAQNLP